MSAGPGIAVFADFDDTLTTTNVAQFLLNRFAPEAFTRHRAEYRSGNITFREYQERSFDAVTVPVSQLQETAADNIELRAGTRELVEAIRNAGGTFTVASAGLALYIDPVLKRNGLESLDVICGTATRGESDTGSFRYDYPFGDSNKMTCAGDWATCKCKALENAGPEAITIFVGDGSTSDACVALKADHVFARDRLLVICRETGIEAMPFEDLITVAEFVSGIGASTRMKSELR